MSRKITGRRRVALLVGGTMMLGLMALTQPKVQAFCGFYVAKADAQLFNRASQVVIARNGDRTVVTMANDFRGNPKEFAMVIPVPTVLRKSQIHVTDKAILDHLDAYTAPRLVEYFDPDPCLVYETDMEMMAGDSTTGVAGRAFPRSMRRRNSVRIEASYTVGEYDILILSADESQGLKQWLIENGYRIPDGADRVLDSYIRQKLRFFVAKVNLKEQSKLGFNTLRPIQIAYESPKFMLPIRLGTVNADGAQDLLVYTLTKNGRVETTNYRTVRLPTDMNIPTYVKNEFGDFYKAMFTEQVKKEDMRAVFLEYAWDMGWCDPCAADPLSTKQLRELGVHWIEGLDDATNGRGGAQNVFVTRLHVRYDGERFPEDLMFHETSDRTNFQGRYVLQHAFQGEMRCESAKTYVQQVRKRQEQEAQTLASLTGWGIADVHAKMDLPGSPDGSNDGGQPASWWERLWRRR